jgi:hypothetical protein
MTNILEQSIKSLFVRTYFDETPLATATGFIVRSSNNDFLITNRHVVTGRNNINNKPLSKHAAIPNKIVISHNIKNCLGQWIDTTELLLDNNDNPLWYEHPTLGARADIVALLLTQTKQIDVYPYDLHKPKELTIQPSDAISVVGFPFGLGVGGKLAIWATGFVASEPEINYDDLPVFLIDCRTRKGQYGSAVIVQRNNGAMTQSGGLNQLKMGSITDFWGVYSGRISKKSDIGMVWKASAVMELIDAIKI